MAGKVDELIAKAKAHLSSTDPGRPEIWRAYVAVEYAILDLKLRAGLEGQEPPAKRRKKDAPSLGLARSMLDRIDPGSDSKKLLYDLRSCRDILKSLVASYDRRSTTS